MSGIQKLEESDLDIEERTMLWGFGLLAWMSVALSSFGTQDQQLGGFGGFESESCRNMILFGWLSTALFCLVAWFFTRVRWFLYFALIVGVGGVAWIYILPHPVLGKGGS